MSADELGPDRGGAAARTADEEVAEPAAIMVDARSSFISFCDSEYPSVVRFVMRCGASLPQAQDATQDAFLDGWQLLVKNPAGWADIRKPQAWIRTLALRKYLRPPGQRRQPVSLPAAEIPEAPQPEFGHADLTAGTLLVLDMLRSLGLRERAVMAYHLDGFSAAEIGRQLGITDQQARDALKKARKILATNLVRARDQEWRPVP